MVDEFSFEVEIKPRFSDFDLFGHVNNAIIVTYLEFVRTQMLERYDKEFNKYWTKLFLMIAHLEVDFLKPITPRISLIGSLRVSKIGNKSWEFEYSITDSTRKTMFVKASSVQVIVDPQLNRSIVLPDDLRTTLGNLMVIEKR